MRVLIASFVALLVVVATPDGSVQRATAQDSYEENVVVVQQRPFLRKGRVEVAPYFALSTNDTLFLHIGAGGVLNYHILENLSVGGSYTKYFSSETDLYGSTQKDFRVFPEKWSLDFYAGGHVSYVPLYGKFILAGSVIVHYDAYLIAGAGVTRTNHSDAAFTGNFGAGARIFLTQWLAFTVEMRDYIFQEEFNSGSRIINNVMLQTGLSFFIPFGLDYRYPK